VTDRVEQDVDGGCRGHSSRAIQSKAFRELAGWLNLELMKNAAEIGYGRFLYAVR
jgi:hypothetical protein